MTGVVNNFSYKTSTGPDQDLIIALGLQPGGLKNLVARQPEALILAFDHDDQRRSALSQALAFPKKIQVGSDWNDFGRKVGQMIVHGRRRNPRLVYSDRYKKQRADDIRALEKIIESARLRKAVIEKTKQEKGRIFLDHLAQNFDRVLRLPLVTELKGALAGVPGFIIGAGPSLEKNALWLNQLGRQGLVLAAASAVRPLKNFGLRPDMVVVVEAEDTSHYLTANETRPGMVLAAASASHPNHFKIPDMFQAAFHLSPGAAFISGSDQYVPQAGMAGGAAFSIGYILGLDPLILIGQDLAFPDGKTHVPGAPDDDPGEAEAAVFKVFGTDGNTVETHSAFAAALEWFAEAVHHIKKTEPGRRIFNTCMEGARIPGLVHAPLERILDKLPGFEKDRPELARMLGASARQTPDEVKSGLEQMRRLVDGVLGLLRRHPEQGLKMTAQLKTSHPFFEEALFGLEPGATWSEASARLEEVEGLILTMHGRVGGT